MDTNTLLKIHILFKDVRGVILFSFSKKHLNYSFYLPKYTDKMTLGLCVSSLYSQVMYFGRL